MELGSRRNLLVKGELEGRNSNIPSDGRDTYQPMIPTLFFNYKTLGVFYYLVRTKTEVCHSPDTPDIPSGQSLIIIDHRLLTLTITHFHSFIPIIVHNPK